MARLARVRGMSGPLPHVLYVQMVTEHRRITPPPADFEKILGLAADLTPVVEQLPPDAFLLDVAGALRFFGRGPAELAARLRVRALALHDLDLTIGAATNPLLARMAAPAPSASSTTTKCSGSSPRFP